jgi:Fic family protein
MSAKEDFEFLNSDIWLKYTQERYTPLDDIKWRLDKLGINKADWAELRQKIQTYRKISSIPFFVNSIEKKFWYFPADCIQKKIHIVETLGNKLFEKIENQKTFKEELLTNSAIEEAITSAIYEGANSTRSQAKQLIASGEKPKNKDEYMLINNYQALKWIKQNSHLEVNLGLILKIHQKVTHNTMEGDDANFSGKFRDDTVYVGSHEGIFFEKIEPSLSEVIKLTTSNPRFLHGLIKGIILHYFIGYIHPFFDGNGRTARTLFYFKAMKNGFRFVELLSVSAHLKEHGKKYERSFDLVKEHELDMTYFVDFCLDSLIAALGKVEEKVNYLVKFTKLSESAGLNLNQVALLQRMALNKYREITIEEYSSYINKSREVARQDLKGMATKGFLNEEKKGKKFVYYIEVKKLKTIIENLTAAEELL